MKNNDFFGKDLIMLQKFDFVDVAALLSERLNISEAKRPAKCYSVLIVYFLCYGYNKPF